MLPAGIPKLSVQNQSMKTLHAARETLPLNRVDVALAPYRPQLGGLFRARSLALQLLIGGELLLKVVALQSRTDRPRQRALTSTQRAAVHRHDTRDRTSQASTRC